MYQHQCLIQRSTILECTCFGWKSSYQEEKDGQAQQAGCSCSCAILAYARRVSADKGGSSQQYKEQHHQDHDLSALTHKDEREKQTSSTPCLFSKDCKRQTIDRPQWEDESLVVVKIGPQVSTAEKHTGARILHHLPQVFQEPCAILERVEAHGVRPQDVSGMLHSIL